MQALLAVSAAKADGAVVVTEQKLGAVREEMGRLKVELYAKFGKSINLETG